MKHTRPLFFSVVRAAISLLRTTMPSVIVMFSLAGFANAGDEKDDAKVDEKKVDPETATVPSSKQLKTWDDADEVGRTVAIGTVEICESIATPLELIPTVGSVLSILIEWGCIIPAAMSADYVSLFHGKRESFVWQSAIALVMSKLWRDLTRWPVAIGIGAVGVALFLGVVALTTGAVFFGFAAAPLYIPVALTGILSGAGIAYIMIRKLRKWGQEELYLKTYALLSSDKGDADQVKALQQEAWVTPILPGWARLWALAAVASGSEPESDMRHMIPIFGPFIKGQRLAEQQKMDFRRLAQDELMEERTESEWGVVDGTITTLSYSEGILASLAQLGLFAGVGFFGVGSLIAAFVTASGPLDLRSPDALWNLGLYASLLLGVGLVGVVVAVSALAFLGLRELVKAVKPIAIPIAYGVFTDRPWFESSPVQAASDPAHASESVSQ